MKNKSISLSLSLFYKFVSFLVPKKCFLVPSKKKPIDNPVQSIGNPFCAFLHRNGLLIYCDLHRFTYSFTHSTFHNECANSLLPQNWRQRVIKRLRVFCFF